TPLWATRCTAASTGACPATSGRWRISPGRFSMQHGSRSRIPPTADEWHLRARCLKTCSGSSTNSRSKSMAIVYKGRVFSVDVETVRTPKGTSHEMATIRHGPCVVVIPILDDGRVVMIRQFRHSVGRNLWELPAGNVDAGEAVDAAAFRECEEETQLAPEHLEELGGLFPAPGYSDVEL